MLTTIAREEFFCYRKEKFELFNNSVVFTFVSLSHRNHPPALPLLLFQQNLEIVFREKSFAGISFTVKFLFKVSLYRKLLQIYDFNLDTIDTLYSRRAAKTYKLAKGLNVYQEWKPKPRHVC